MQIGISLHNNWGIEDVQALVQLASRAEALGFDSVWVHDHVFNAGHVFTRIGRKPTSSSALGTGLTTNP